MLHIQVATGDARPDRVIATGVWQRYPVEESPSALVQKNAEAFTRWATRSPSATPGPQPEEVALAANRLAVAMAGGAKVPKWVDQRLVNAAKLINAGQEFVITSGGRSITVSPRQGTIAVTNPLEPISRNVR